MHAEVSKGLHGIDATVDVCEYEHIHLNIEQKFDSMLFTNSKQLIIRMHAITRKKT